MRILVFGGTGYIGSHTCVELAARGHELVIADNLSNSSEKVLDRLQAITGRTFDFCRVDLRDRDATFRLLAGGGFDAVIHFAALKAVGESCERPLDYFDNNIAGTLNLLQAMRHAQVRRLVFSSSATVYGDPERVPVDEDAPLSVTNPYGRTKLVMEQLIGDLCVADPGFQAGILRYFNPVGAHASGLIGEDPSGVPSNLMPYICQVAEGRRERLSVFGGDWPTIDGSGVRDYIHVVDLARAHADALDTLARTGTGFTVNLGTGRGYSVLEVIRAYEAASGQAVPYRVVPRRPGDVAACYADPSLARDLLGWTARYDLARMCEDSWRWQRMNPNGYAEDKLD